MQCPCQQNFSLCLELRLKTKSQLQKIIFLRDFDFHFDTYLFSFLTHFDATWYQNSDATFYKVGYWRLTLWYSFATYVACSMQKK